jgi:orotate phosphoribosyltransferase
VSDVSVDATARRVEALFSRAGAYRDGHFKLKSGRHSQRYLEKFQVLQWPAAVTELCEMIADRGRAVAGSSVDVVVGPTTGGVILAFEVARLLGVRGFFAERVAGEEGSPPRRAFRRGFAIEPGERVLLVDDVVTTGASLVEMLPPIEQAGGELAATVVLVDRSGGLREVTSPLSGRSYPAQALWTLDLPTFEPGAASCPGCAAGLPLDAPGSSGAAAPT